MTDEELERIRAKLRAELTALGQARERGAVDVTDAEFDAFVRKHPIVLVDVWAPWCGPCRRMSPLVEQLGREWAGRVAVAKVNADDNPDLVARYRIRGIPTFLWFHNGGLVGQLVGVQPAEAFRQALAEIEAGPSTDPSVA